MSQLTRRARRAKSAARPLAWPVLVCTVVCVLTPRPAFADPGVAGAPVPQPTSTPTASANSNLAIPDTGSTPAPSAPLPAVSSSAAPAAPAVTGPFASDILAKYADEELAGQKLTQANTDLAVAQSATKTTYDLWQKDLTSVKDLQSKANGAAAKAYEDATGLGPLGDYANQVHQLGLLAPAFGDGTRGGPAGSETAAQDAALAKARLNIDEQAYRAALAHEQQLAGQQTTLQTSHDQLTATLASLNTANSAALAQAQAAQALVDQGLAGRYLAGTKAANQAANPKALAALQYALARVNNPRITYLWGTEGPVTYDCSGLVWAAYQSTGYTWDRLTAADQFNHTRSQEVSPSQLLPGDLLFFNRSLTDWTQIYHVAIYLGDNQMVEAAYNGRPLDIATVHWSTFFAATRVYPAVAPVTPHGPYVPPPTTPPPAPTPPPVSTQPPASPTPSPGTPPVPTGPPTDTPPPSETPPPSDTPPPASDAPPPSTTPTEPAPSTGTTPTESAPSGDTTASVSPSAASDPSAGQSAGSDPSAGQASSSPAASDASAGA